MKRASPPMHTAARAVLVGASALLAACDSAIAPPFPDDAPPTAFNVNVSGFVYGSHDVTLHGDTLVVVRARDFRPGQTTTSWIIPGRANWQAFWRAADAAAVRKWASRCENQTIVDGGGYTLRIEYAGGTIDASGFNAYPQRDGRCTTDGQYSAEFEAFMKAVSTLIGVTYP